MRMTKKLFGNLNRARSAKVSLLIAVIIAVIGFLALPLTGCSEDGGDGGGGSSGDKGDTGDNDDTGGGNGGSPVPPIEMVLIPAGTFMMGSPANEPSRDSDETQHSVILSDFSMSKYQVTQAQYQAVMGAGEDRTTTNYGKGDNYPIYYVSWYDAIVFCNKLSVLEGLDPVYSISLVEGDPNSTDPDEWGTVPASNDAKWNSVVMDKSKNGYRLPTEAEWEYACRAETMMPFNTGDNITTDQANYNGNYPYNSNAEGIYRGKTTPVGSFAPNPWELYDMHGNVWEWCWDWYGSYPIDAQTDPTGSVTGVNRVRRGGSWDNVDQFLRSAFRNYFYPYFRYYYVGFRLVHSN